MRSLLFSAVLFALSVVLFAEDKSAAVQTIDGKRDFDFRFERMDPAGEPLIRPTGFAVFCDENELIFDLSFLAEENSGLSEKKSAVELFFQPDGLTGKQEYYQFYGELEPWAVSPTALTPFLNLLGVPWMPNMKILPYYYAPTREGVFPYLFDYRVEQQFLANSCSIRIAVPWCDLLGAFPFDDEGRGKVWRFNLIRNACGVAFAWQGKHHRPETWGRLVFSDIPKGKLAGMYRSAALRACDHVRLQRWRFDVRSMHGGAEKLVAELEKKKNAIPVDPAALSIPAWRELAAELRALSTGRRLITVAPDPAANGLPPGWTVSESPENLTYTYRFQKNVSNAYILDFNYSGPADLSPVLCVDDMVLTDDGKPLASGMAARHFHFGAAYRDSTLTLAVPKQKNGKRSHARFSFTVEMFGDGFLPPAPVSLQAGLTTQPQAPCGRDGTVSAPYLSRHLPQCVQMLNERPAVVWFGDSMMDGLGFTSAYRDFEQQISTAECGVVADNPRRLLWRIENGVFDVVKPLFVVLSVDAGRDPDRTFDGIKKIVSELKKRTPQTRILLTAAFPHRTELEFADTLPFARLNRRLAAEIVDPAERIFFIDLTNQFYGADKKLIQSRFDRVYFQPEIYQAWTDAATAVIKAELPKIEQDKEVKK